MKRLLILMSLVLRVVLAACGGQSPEPAGSSFVQQIAAQTAAVYRQLEAHARRA